MKQQETQNRPDRQEIWAQIRQTHRLPREWTAAELPSSLPDGYCSGLAGAFQGLSDEAWLAAARRIPSRHLEPMMLCLLDESAGMADLQLISRILMIRMKPRLARLGWLLLQQQPDNRFLVQLCGRAAQEILKTSEPRYPMSPRLIRHPSFQSPPWVRLLAEGLADEGKAALSNLQPGELIDQKLIPHFARYFFEADPAIPLAALIQQMEIIPEHPFFHRLGAYLFLRFDAAALKENETVLFLYFRHDPPETAAVLSRYLTLLDPADYHRAVCEFFLDRYDIAGEYPWRKIDAKALEKIIRWRYMIQAQDWLKNNPVKWKSFQPYIMNVDKVCLADEQKTLYLFFSQVVICNTADAPLSATLIPRRLFQAPEAGAEPKPAVAAPDGILDVKDVILAENADWQNTRSLIALMRRGETSRLMQVNFDHIAILYAHQVLRELLT